MNRIENYNSQKDSGIATYVKFPQTFPGHIPPPQSTYFKSNDMGSLVTTSSQIREHTPYAVIEPFNKAEQVLDHHYLTRPMSVISTPLGTHYLPHILSSVQKPTYLGHGTEHYYHYPNPTSALKHGNPSITVFAENIYINNDSPKMFWSKIDPRVEIQNGEKQDLLSAKLSLLKLLMKSTYPENVSVDNKLEVVNPPSLGSIKPNFMPLQSSLLNEPGAPSRLPYINVLKLQTKIPNVFKGTDNQFEFHPLLNPSEHLQQTKGNVTDNVTDGKAHTGNTEKHEHETTLVEISTDMKGVTGKHDQNEVLISVEGLNNETED